jgi:hypothetical protein
VSKQAAAAAFVAFVCLAAALAACNSRQDAPSASASAKPSPPPAAANPASAPPSPGWRTACLSALASLEQVEPAARVARIFAACPVCDLAPILRDLRANPPTAPWLPDLDASVAACGGYCGRDARSEFLSYVRHQLELGEPGPTPWRKLGEACPRELGLRDDTRGFVGATWFILQRLGVALGGATSDATLPAPWPTVTFPLPAMAVQGGVELPEAAGAPRLPPGRLAVTVFAEQTWVGHLPWGRLTSTGVIVEGTYPGAPAKALSVSLARAAASAAAFLVPLPNEPVALLAPYGLPATRLVEVLRALSAPARLAVRSELALPDYAPPMVLAPLLSARPANGAMQLDLSQTSAAALSELAAHLAASSTREVTLTVHADIVVDDVANAISALRAASTIAIVAGAR